MSKIHGNLEECTKRFSTENGFKNADREGCITRNKVCFLLGIGSAAGHEWFDNGVMPKGVNRLKLFVFLELLGYVIEERQGLSELQKRIGACLALSSATPKEIADFASVNDGAVLRWANGDTVPLPAKISVIEEVVGLYQAEVSATLKRWQDSIDPIGVKSSVRRPVTKTAPSEANNKSPDVPHDQVVETVVRLVTELEPLTQRLVSDEFTPEDRKQLRELTSLPNRSHLVFELSNQLNRLCGEKARNELPESRTQQSATRT